MYLYLDSFGAHVDKISVMIVGMYCGPPPLSRTGLVPAHTLLVGTPPPTLPPPIFIIVHVVVQLSHYFYLLPQDGSGRQST